MQQLFSEKEARLFDVSLKGCNVVSMNALNSNRAPRFSHVTKGIRLRVDQIAALEQLFSIDPELDWSKAVRRGIDLFLTEVSTRLNSQPAVSMPQVFQSISSAVSPRANRSADALDMNRTPARSRAKATR